MFFTRLVGRRFGRRSSCRRSLIRCCRRSSVVLPLVVAVGRCRWSSCRPSSGRLSVVGRWSLSSSVSRWSSVVLSVVRRPFPFPVLRLPNCRGTLSPTAFHHGRPVCLLPPPGLLTVSQLSSSRLQLTLPTTVRGVSPAPPFGFRLLASARRLPPLGPLRSSTSPPRLRGSLLLLGLPQASRDRLVPSCPRRLAGLGRPLSGLSRAIPSGRLASPEGFLLYEFRSSGSFPRFLLGPFWVPFWVPSGSLLGPFWVPSGSLLGSSFLASLPHFSGRPVHPCRLPALHDLPWVRSDSHFPGSCSSFPSSASGVFSSLREGASIPPLHVMHFLSLPHSFFAMTGFWLSPTLYFVPYSSFSSYLPWVLLHF